MARNQRLVVQVTAEEKEAIRSKMKQIGMTNMSEFVRLAVNVNPILNLDMNGIYKLSYEINRIGNNINQIAKQANRSGTVYKNDLAEINDKLQQLNNFVDLINKKARLSKSKEE